MLGFMSERLSSWEKIKQSGREVVVYGMGNGADNVLDEFARLDIKVRGVTASDNFVKGQSFRGFTVQKLSEFNGDFIIAVAFASCIPRSWSIFILYAINTVCSCLSCPCAAVKFLTANSSNAIPSCSSRRILFSQRIQRKFLRAASISCSAASLIRSGISQRRNPRRSRASLSRAVTRIISTSAHIEATRWMNCYVTPAADTAALPRLSRIKRLLQSSRRTLTGWRIARCFKKR